MTTAIYVCVVLRAMYELVRYDVIYSISQTERNR